MTTQTKKAPGCCTRRLVSLRRAEADLRMLARRAARRPERREHWGTVIPKARAAMEDAKQNLIDHEAEHDL